MNIKTRKPKLVAEINITPFTDVILVLLIIFMVATPLIFQSSIKINLPEAGTAAPLTTTAKKNDMMYISITDEGLRYVDNDLVTKKELKETMSRRYKENPSIGVVLRIDKLVRFKDIVDVLDSLSELGITNLHIAATPE